MKNKTTIKQYCENEINIRYQITELSDNKDILLQCTGSSCKVLIKS